MEAKKEVARSKAWAVVDVKSTEYFAQIRQIRVEQRVVLWEHDTIREM